MPSRKTDQAVEMVHVLVLIDEALPCSWDEVRDRLESSGMRVETTFPMTRAIAGSVAAVDIPKLRAVHSVVGIEPEPEFRTSRIGDVAS